MKDAAFTNTVNNIECQEWNAFIDVVKNFLGDVKDPRYKETVENMSEKLRVYGCNTSLKLHLLHSHLDYFPGNLGAFSEEQSEMFHQDLKELERRYQRRWGVNMMADYCWSVKQEDTSQEHSQTASSCSFTGNRKHRCSGLHPNFLENVNRLFQLQLYFQMSCIYVSHVCTVFGPPVRISYLTRQKPKTPCQILR